jgi:hypothetical protein
VDAGIFGIVEPTTPSSPGLSNVRGLLRNFGQDTITSVSLGWAVNGTAQTPQTWTGVLAPQATDTVLFGSFTFPTGVHTIEAWTSMPNNLVDSNAFNDTTSSSVIFCNLYSGNYTIGGAGADFPDIMTAINAIASCGINGAVTLNINSGTYNEQVTVPEIPGANAMNTITIQSTTGNADDVTIAHSASGTNHTFLFDGADYVTLQNLTLEANAASSARVIVLGGGANFNIITGCKIISNPLARSSSASAGIYDNSGLDEYNIFTYNEIENGYYGIYVYGSSSAVLQAGNIVENNTLTGFYYYGIYAYYLQAPKINHNTLENHTSSGWTYGLTCGYCQNEQEIIGNRVHLFGTSTQYGLRVYYCTATDSTMGLVANNMVSITGSGTSTNYGLYWYYSNYQNYYYNSVNMAAGASGSYPAYIYQGANSNSMNNLFCNNVGGYSVYVLSLIHI